MDKSVPKLPLMFLFGKYGKYSFLHPHITISIKKIYFDIIGNQI